MMLANFAAHKYFLSFKYLKWECLSNQLLYKTIFAEYFNPKEAFNATVTHQFFSIAIAGSPVLLLA